MTDETAAGTHFINEFGRSIRVSVRPIQLLRIEIEGPDSSSRNDVTRMEATRLLEALREALS